MGNWNINVQGFGCHHNGPTHDTDANNMARKFVAALKSAGHTVQVATFTHGSAETLDPKRPATDYPGLLPDSRTDHEPSGHGEHGQ